MRHEKIALNGDTHPYQVIKFIESNFPELKGICYFDKEYKSLATNDIRIAEFYFDPMHKILEITWNEYYQMDDEHKFQFDLQYLKRLLESSYYYNNEILNGNSGRTKEILNQRVNDANKLYKKLIDIILK